MAEIAAGACRPAASRHNQTSLRALGIEIAFGREGRGGTRIIRMTASHENSCENTVSTVTDGEPFKPERELGGPGPFVRHPNDAEVLICQSDQVVDHS